MCELEISNSFSDFSNSFFSESKFSPKTSTSLSPSEQKSLSIQIQKALADCRTPQPLPVHLQHNPLDIVLKGSSVIAVNSILKPILLKHIAGQFALHFARYQGAKTALVQGGAIANQIALQTAKQGMTTAAARYGAVRTVLSLVGPALWGWFIADLGWKAIATDYGRIIPTIFALAQIRLTREITQFRHGQWSPRLVTAPGLISIKNRAKAIPISYLLWDKIPFYLIQEHQRETICHSLILAHPQLAFM